MKKTSNCKLQLVSYDTKYDESYVWDGKMAAAYGQHRDFGCYFLVDEDSDNFVVKLEGQETAEELVYDVNAKNDIVSVPLANVTIRNLNLKKDELNTICLPFSVSKEEMDRVFGEGTELYEADSYRSMQDADTIFFKPSTGKNYHDRPALCHQNNQGCDRSDVPTSDRCGRRTYRNRHLLGRQ